MLVLSLKPTYYFSIISNISALGLKKKLFVSYNPTLTSFFHQKEYPYPKVFSTLPAPNQRKTCIKQTFLTKKLTKKNKHFTDLPNIFLGPLQKTNNFYLCLKTLHHQAVYLFRPFNTNYP